MLDPAIMPAYASTELRILRRRLVGARRYVGDTISICRAIVEACWTGDHFAASGGHFRQFWIRDFGFSAPSLIRLGHGARVEASLAWALDTWARRGRVTTTIFPGRRPADVYTLGIDSLPFLLLSLESGGHETLVRRHAGWLAPEVVRYGQEALDRRTGLVRDDRRFSTHRDTVRSASNCYANTMLVALDGVLGRTGWFPSPIPAATAERLIDVFWRGNHFSDRPDRDEVTGDANVFPFWLRTVPDALGLAAALTVVERAGLTRPLPLRYAARRDRASEDRVQGFFVPDYQGSAIWTSLGAMYVALLRRVDPPAAAAALAGYARLVERDGTLREVLTDDLQPYRGRFGLYVADEAMLWASILLEEVVRGQPRPVDGLASSELQEDPRPQPGGAVRPTDPEAGAPL